MISDTHALTLLAIKANGAKSRRATAELISQEAARISHDLAIELDQIDLADLKRQMLALYGRGTWWVTPAGNEALLAWQADYDHSVQALEDFVSGDH